MPATFGFGIADISIAGSSYAARLSCFIVSAQRGALAQAAAPAAARHGKDILMEIVAAPRSDDLAQFAGHKRHHPDAVGADNRVQRPGNRAANQRVHRQFHQPERQLRRLVVGQRFLCFAGDPSRFVDLNEADLPGAVKDRRNAIVPVCKCRFPHAKPCASIWPEERAFVVPERQRGEDQFK